MRKNGGVETTIPHNSSLLWRWSQPNTFTTPCFPGLGGVELFFQELECSQKGPISCKKTLIWLWRDDVSLLQAKKEDILSRFLLERERDPGCFDNKYLRDIILNFVIAGRNTTAGTLAWFLYVLWRNCRKYALEGIIEMIIFPCIHDK